MNAPEKHDLITVQQHEVAAPVGSPMGMMMAAMKQGASLEQISQMMDLQERWQKAEAKKAYDAAFAAFKAEGVRIVKGRKVTDGPLKGKSYAELHDIVNAVTETLSKHGLSSWWRLTKDDRDWLEVTCYLRHVGGHEESVSMGGPPDTGGAKNTIQSRASAKTYLERYTLKAILGLSEELDDNDGNGPPRSASPDELLASARNAALQGSAHFRAYHSMLTSAQQESIRPELPSLRQAAEAADRPAVYPQDRFDENLPKWREVIEQGRKTADQLIAVANTKAELTPRQQAVLRAIKSKAGGQS